MTNLLLIIIATLFLVNSIAAILIWFKFRSLFLKYCELRSVVFGSLDLLRLRFIQEKMRLKNMAEKQNTSLSPIHFSSQFSEEMIIFEILDGIDPGVFVEAGAYDGVNLSTTYFLEQIGWNGLLVEPNERNAQLCREKRVRSIVENCALGNMDATGTIEFTLAESEGGSPLSYVHSDSRHVERCKQADCRLTTQKVPYTNLNSLLEKNGFQRVDFISLDVEGMELEVLRGFSLEKFKPRLAMIELQFDDRDKAVIEHMAQYQYAPIVKKECNLFFVPIEIKSKISTKLFPYDEKVIP